MRRPTNKDPNSPTKASHIIPSSAHELQLRYLGRMQIRNRRRLKLGPIRAFYFCSHDPIKWMDETAMIRDRVKADAWSDDDHGFMMHTIDESGDAYLLS